jgi:hypothetical protein
VDYFCLKFYDRRKSHLFRSRKCDNYSHLLIIHSSESSCTVSTAFFVTSDADPLIQYECYILCESTRCRSRACNCVASYLVDSVFVLTSTERPFILIIYVVFCSPLHVYVWIVPQSRMQSFPTFLIHCSCH